MLLVQRSRFILSAHYLSLNNTQNNYTYKDNPKQKRTGLNCLFLQNYSPDDATSFTEPNYAIKFCPYIGYTTLTRR